MADPTQYKVCCPGCGGKVGRNITEPTQIRVDRTVDGVKYHLLERKQMQCRSKKCSRFFIVERLGDPEPQDGLTQTEFEFMQQSCVTPPTMPRV